MGWWYQENVSRYSVLVLGGRGSKRGPSLSPWDTQITGFKRSLMGLLTKYRWDRTSWLSWVVWDRWVPLNPTTSDIGGAGDGDRVVPHSSVFGVEKSKMDPYLSPHGTQVGEWNLPLTDSFTEVRGTRVFDFPGLYKIYGSLIILVSFTYPDRTSKLSRVLKTVPTNHSQKRSYSGLVLLNLSINKTDTVFL